MRRAITIAVLIGSTALFAIFPTSPANAQYELVEPNPFSCPTLAPPTVIVTSGMVTVTFGPNSVDCVDDVVVQIDPVLYRGPVPKDRLLEVPIPAIYPGFDIVITTVTLVDGDTIIIKTRIPRGDETPPPAPPLAQDDPGEPGEPVTNQQRRTSGTTSLPVTGAPISLQASMGAVLIGSGGLILLFAKRRQDRE